MPVYGVEVYLPWNDTWIKLPLLPDLGEGGGRIARTQIMSIPDGFLALYLLGGGSMDKHGGAWNDNARVWHLQWDYSSHNYSWRDRQTPKMGNLSFTKTTFSGSTGVYWITRFSFFKSYKVI